MEKGFGSRKSQVAIFVIVAIIIVALVLGFFVFKDRIFSVNMPTEISPVFNYYTSCIQSNLEDAASLAGSHAGYLENPEFSAGTNYAPFSSELNFLGQGVPYWYYLSGNGVAVENIPSKTQIEQQMNTYLKQEFSKCGLDSFIAQGYNVTLGEPTFKTSIKSDQISSIVSQKISIGFADKSFTVNSFDVQITNSFGSLYDTAKLIYDYEKKTSFLENYSTDVLYTYAPVSGTEFNCSPMIWDPHTVFTKLRQALETNIQLIRVPGNYYQKVDPYFITGKNSSLNVKNAQVSFSYSGDWASRFEVWPTESNLMVANPIGNQPGLSAMGFCYVPYKFVYDLYFPVMIQVYNSDASELFQFPVAVVINKNVARESQQSEYTAPVESICNNANTEVTISTYDINLQPVEASVKFRCLTDSCEVGKTQLDNATGLASITKLMPQCVNGVLVVNAPGYKEKKYVISTNEESNADIILDKEYKLPLEIYVDNSLVSDSALLIVSDTLENQTTVISAISYPSTKQITLGEGNYTFNLQVFKSSGVNIPATTTQQCVNVPQEGILGMFGFDSEQCTDLTIPAQNIANVIFAGGNQNQYLVPGELDGAKVFRIYAAGIKVPSSVDEVQASYDTIQGQGLDILIE